MTRAERDKLRELVMKATPGPWEIRDEEKGNEMKNNVQVKLSEEKPESKDILAAAIIRISDSVDQLRKSGLNHRAIVALLKDDTGMGKTQIEAVLESLAELRRKYCK